MSFLRLALGLWKCLYLYKQRTLLWQYHDLATLVIHIGLWSMLEMSISVSPGDLLVEYARLVALFYS